MMWWLAVATASAPVIEVVGEGQLDWTTLELRASALATPSSGAVVNHEVVEDEARSRLGPLMLELARRIRVDHRRTVGTLLDANDDLAQRIDQNLSLWEVYETRYYTSGRVEIDGAMPVLGLLRPLLVRTAAGRERESPPTGSTSGLVVDARGLPLTPAVAPRVLAPDGSVLYALEGVTSASASARTPVVYVSDPADVRAVQRAGAQPLLLTATGVVDEVDLTLSAEDAALVREKAAGSPFLLHAAVVVVSGAAPAVAGEPK